MTFDAADGYVLLFGGLNGGSVVGDTWKWVHGSWIQLHPAAAPSARLGAAMAYDAKDGYVVLFGGSTVSGPLSDTWKFLHGTWTHLTPATHPTALDDASLAYDGNATDQYLVLFGGAGIAPFLSSATWKFVGGTWTLLAPPTSPSGRAGAGMAYDPALGTVVLFGGENGTGPTVLADTWNFTHGRWTHLAPASSPPARELGGVAYDLVDNLLVLFGGKNLTVHRFADSWAYANGTWTQQFTSFSPSARDSFGIASSSSGNSPLLLFGGQGAGGARGDGWTFSAGVWKHALVPTPQGRGDGVMAYDEADRYVVLFGGIDKNLQEARNQTWVFQGGGWHLLVTPVAPTARALPGFAYDQADGYMVLFGGQLQNATSLADTWSFLKGVWKELPASGPAPRYDFGMTYDAADGYIVLFGGPASSGAQDTWSFSDGNWTLQVSTFNCMFIVFCPSTRQAAVMAYDSYDGEVILYGGLDLSTAADLTDTWGYTAGVWTNLTSSTTPGTKEYSSMVYDAKLSALLLFGGRNSSGDLNTSYLFQGGTWSPYTVGRAPAGRYSASMAYDPLDGEVVLFGGAEGFPIVADTWLLA